MPKNLNSRTKDPPGADLYERSLRRAPLCGTAESPNPKHKGQLRRAQGVALPLWWWSMCSTSGMQSHPGCWLISPTCPPQVYAQQQHSTAQHVSLHSPAEGADIATRMAAASMPAPAPPRLPYGAFPAAHPPISQATSLMARRPVAAEGCGGLPHASACYGSAQIPGDAAKSSHPGSAAGCALDEGSFNHDPPRTPSAAARACDMGGSNVAECTPEPGGERSAAGSKAAGFLDPDAGYSDPDGRHSPDAVLAWADAWSAPAKSTAAGSGTEQRRSDGAAVGSEAWRERLMDALACGLSSQGSAAPGAGLSGRTAAATHIMAFSGAIDSLGSPEAPCCICLWRYIDKGVALMQQEYFGSPR